MRAREVWRNGGFRRLWGSVGVSLVGTQVSLLALPLTAIGVLHASAGQVALLAAAGTAPFLLLGLPAGAWVDRWARRPLMVRTDLLRALLLVSVPVAYAAGVLTLAQLYLVAFGVGALSVFFDVAALSVLPALVSHEQIAPANGQLEVARATAQTTGPALGGALVQAVTAPVAVALDAVSYLASAVLLRGLPELAPPPAPAQRERLGRQIRDGLRFCLRHPYIRPLAAGAAWMNFWTEALLAVFVVYAVRELHLTPAVVGVVLAASNVGYLVGSLLVPRLNARVGVGPAIAVGAALNAGFVPVALAPRAWTVAWLTAGFTVTAIGVAIWNVNAVSLRQASTPPALLARMNATNRFLIWGTMPLGAAAGGLLTGLAGLHATIVVAALAAPASAVPILLSAVRRVRVMPQPVDVPGR
jgi:MFS family permease